MTAARKPSTVLSSLQKAIELATSNETMAADDATVLAAFEQLMASVTDLAAIGPTFANLSPEERRQVLAITTSKSPPMERLEALQEWLRTNRQ